MDFTQATKPVEGAVTVSERADHIARRILVPHANAYFVCVTEHQQEKVIAALKAALIPELASIEDSVIKRFHVKFD